MTRQPLRPTEPGESPSIEALIERHEGALLRTALRGVGERALAEDVVQEAFVAWLRRPDGGAGIDDPAAWLHRVVRHRARDALRKEARVHRRESVAAAPEGVPPAGDPLERDERRDAVARLLSTLDLDVREALELSVIEGMSYRRIAAVTGASLGTVAHRVHTGLSRISGGLRSAGVI